jgi:Lipoprotein NlpI, contains TPR repeats
MKKSIKKKNKNFIEPSPEVFQSLIYSYSNGDLQGTLNKAKTLLKEYPDSPTLYNICGITYSDLDKYEDALDNFYLALQINPNYADCHYKKGNTLQSLRQLRQGG